MDEARIRLLVGAWFDGALTAEEKTEMEAVLRSSRRARALFWEEADAHALLAEAGARQKAVAAGPPVAAARVRAGFRVPFFARRKAAVAAAAALLLGGGIVALRLVPPAAPARPRAAALHPAAPVRLIRQTGMQGLELPAVLPGRVRLRQGLATVRLLSGVELTLQGPLDLTFESASGVEARLERGRLLAWVPPRANGLIIRTRELEAWDIGTVFSVSADTNGSALLVFKGQVQVMESNGDAVGLCEAGEGAWAGANDRTVWKTSLDALKDRGAFTAMQGDAALKSPVAAMDLARRIQEAWVGAFTPQDSARMQERRKQLAAERAAAARVPFSKQAWVRPAAPAPQQE
ncbi:MAG: FecR domain-containing protein, partial [Kiritimatiellia bacterium]|nr:FecR domain-containing protein [Kiritimatiellia bacterium]